MFFYCIEFCRCLYWLSSINMGVWCLDKWCLNGDFFDVLVFKWVLNGVWCLDNAKDL